MDFLTEWIERIFNNMSGIAASVTDNVTKTPADIFGKDWWNSLLKIGMSVVMPFAITILCYCMAAELYHVYCKSNGGLDIELVLVTFIKFILPFTLIMKTYDLLQWIFTTINNMVRQIYTHLNLGTGNAVDTSAWAQQISQMTFMQKIWVWMQLMFPWLLMAIMSVVVTVIVYGRIFEIVFYWIFAPIPMAMLVSEEFSSVGKNFIKMFCALVLQGGFMVLAVALWTMLIKSTTLQANFAGAWAMVGYTGVLMFSLTKSGALAKRLLGTF